VISDDGTWSDSVFSEYSGFVTKTSLPSVEFTNIEDGDVVTSLTQAVVSASDSSHRFSSFGITEVRLFIDGQEVESSSTDPGTSSISYTFDLGELDLQNGLHTLEAMATDDYWNVAFKTIHVRVASYGSMQAESTKYRSMDLLGSSSGTKEKGKGQVSRPILQLVQVDPNGRDQVGHSYFRIKGMSDLYGSNEDTYTEVSAVGLWPQFGKKCALLYGHTGEIVDETCVTEGGSVPKSKIHQYIAAHINRKEQKSIEAHTYRDRTKNTPIYDLTPLFYPYPIHYERAHQNCTTWIGHILKTRIKKLGRGLDPGVTTTIPAYYDDTGFFIPEQKVEFIPYRPAHIPQYAALILEERKKQGKE